MFYDLHIFVCCNQRPEGAPRPCCGKERGESIRNRFKQEIRKQKLRGKIRVNKSGCLDRCELNPCIVIYPEGAWYRVDDQQADIEEIVREHLIGGRPVERLMLPERRSDS